MRRLQIATTLFFVAGIGILLSFPWTVGSVPGAEASDQAKAAYAIRLLIFFGGAGLCLLLSALFATVLVRRIRREYREQLVSNLADLLATPPSKSAKDGDDDSR